MSSVQEWAALFSATEEPRWFSASRAWLGDLLHEFITQLGWTNFLQFLSPAMLRDDLSTLRIWDVISPKPLKSFYWAHGVSLGWISELRHLDDTWLSKQLMCIWAARTKSYRAGLDTFYCLSASFGTQGCKVTASIQIILRKTLQTGGWYFMRCRTAFAELMTPLIPWAVFKHRL